MKQITVETLEHAATVLRTKIEHLYKAERHEVSTITLSDINNDIQEHTLMLTDCTQLIDAMNDGRLTIRLTLPDNAVI